MLLNQYENNCDNALLFVNYGFVPETPSNEFVKIILILFQEDPTIEVKRMLIKNCDVQAFYPSISLSHPENQRMLGFARFAFFIDDDFSIIEAAKN